MNTNHSIMDFRRNLRKIERAVTNSMKTEGNCCGVTFNECHILLEIADLDSTNINSLSDILSIDKSIISKTVDELFRKELIHREEDGNDRRKKKIRLTETGLDRISHINRTMNDLYSGRFSGFSSEEIKIFFESVENLAGLLRKWNCTANSDENGGTGNECNCN